MSLGKLQEVVKDREAWCIFIYLYHASCVNYANLDYLKDSRNSGNLFSPALLSHSDIQHCKFKMYKVTIW